MSALKLFMVANLCYQVSWLYLITQLSVFGWNQLIFFHILYKTQIKISLMQLSFSYCVMVHFHTIGFESPPIQSLRNIIIIIFFIEAN